MVDFLQIPGYAPHMKVLITGVSSGIGRALTIQLIEQGHEVWGVARRADMLAELTSTVVSPRLHVAPCDVKDAAHVTAVAAEMRTAGFIPDVVVLNAGVFISDIHGGFHFDAHQESFDINLNGALRWVAEFLPDFLARGAGTFIAVSSTAAFRPSGSASYSGSKAALSMAFRQFAMSFADTGITFSTVHFGPIDTRLWPGRRFFLVPSSGRAAAYVARMFDRPSGSYFFPSITTTLLRLSFFVPDRVFRFFARYLRP